MILDLTERLSSLLEQAVILPTDAKLNVEKKKMTKLWDYISVNPVV